MTRLETCAVVASMLLLGASVARGQELDVRAYAPAPVGTTLFLVSVGSSQGGVLLDPALDVDNVQADLSIATIGAGRTFALAGRQARWLAVVPFGWGTVEGQVHDHAERQDLVGIVDPRFRLSIGLRGPPAMTMSEFAGGPRRTATGVSVTVVPPWGRYTSRQLVNLGHNRWAVKPEVGISQPLDRWTLDAAAGVWMFSTNDEYYPGRAVKHQDVVLSLQGHVSYMVTRRAWVAFDGTWFSGGETRVDGAPQPDFQRNVRLGATLSIPLASQQSMKLAYSAGAATRRGSDFNTFTATWQVVLF
jgi:hypothetical protein